MYVHISAEHKLVEYDNGNLQTVTFFGKHSCFLRRNFSRLLQYNYVCHSVIFAYHKVHSSTFVHTIMYSTTIYNIINQLVEV